MSTKPLSEQQVQFCLNVIANGGNGTAAAIEAKYAKAGARVRAHKLLKDPRIKAKIAELTARAAQEAAQRVEAAGVTALAEQAITDVAAQSSIERAVESLKEKVMRRLVSLGLTELPEIATWDEDSVQFIPSAELTESARGSVQSVKTKSSEIITDKGSIMRRTTMEVKQHPPMPALRELMKLVGMVPRDEGKHPMTAVGVQVIISGGPTGIEAGVAPDAQFVAQNPSIVAESAEIVPESATSGSPGAPRPWRPGPRKNGLASVAAAARAALVAP